MMDSFNASRFRSWRVVPVLAALTLIAPAATVALSALRAAPVAATVAGGNHPGVQPAGTCVQKTNYSIWEIDSVTLNNDTIARDGVVPPGSTPSTPFGYGVSVAAPGPMTNDTWFNLGLTGNHTAPAYLWGWTMVVLTVPAHASEFSWNSDGSFTYDVPPSYVGGDSFTYALTDGSGQCFGGATVTILPAHYDHVVNDSYNVFAGQTFSPTPGLAVCDTHNAPTGGAWPACGLLENDVASYVGGWTTSGSGNATSFNDVTTFATAHGSVTLHADGDFSYTPTSGYFGDDSFEYAANAGHISCTPTCVLIFPSSLGTDGSFATVTLHVENKPAGVMQNSPVTLSVNENTMLPSGFTPLTFNKSSLDSGQPDTSSIVGINGSAIGAPSVRTNHGTIALTWETGLATQTGFLVPCPPGDEAFCQPVDIASMTYTPDQEFFGSDRFSYFTQNELNATGYVPIPTLTYLTVNEVTTRPLGKEFPNVVVNNHSSYTFNLRDGVTDPDGLALVGQATLTGPAAIGTVPPSGTLVSNGGGSYTFNATAAGSSDGYLGYIFDIPVQGGGPAVETSIAIGVAPYAAVNDGYSVDENQILSVSAPGVLGNDDPPPVGASTVSLDTQAQNGTVALNSDGSFTYTPNTNFHGTDTFTYLNNGYVGTVTITVNHILQSPVVFLNSVCVPSPFGICVIGDYDNRGNLSEGDHAQLRGSITDPEGSTGVFTVNWGDGTIDNYPYPCAPGATTCPFQSTPTWNLCLNSGCVGGAPVGPEYFELHHVYTNIPSGGAPNFSITATANANDGKSGNATGAAYVHDVAPTVTISPDCPSRLCVSSFSALTQPPGGGNVVIGGRVLDPGTDQGLLTVDWGDGTTDTQLVTCDGTHVCGSIPNQSGLCGSILTGAPPSCGYFAFTHQYPTPAGSPVTYHVTVTEQSSPNPISPTNPGIYGTAHVDTTALPPFPQTITFNPPPSATVGETPIPLSATGGGSGNAITFSLDATSGPGVCSLAGSTLSFDHIGSCIVDANQAGNAAYLDAPTVTKTITVVGKTDTITNFSLSPTGLVNDPPITLTATGGGSSNPVTFSVDANSTAGACMVNNTMLTLTGAGTCVVDANQQGDTVFADATPVQASITVSRRVDTITNFNLPPVGTVGGSVLLSATGGGSSKSVTFSVDVNSTAGACMVNNTMLTLTGAGTCVVDANQQGDTIYLDAIPVQQNMTVLLTQTITFTPPTARVIGGTYIPTATATSGMAVKFTLDANSTPGTCSLSATTLTFTNVGSCVIDANQLGGGSWAAAPQVQRSITVEYGFGGFLSPLAKATVNRKAGVIPVQFRLTNFAAQPIASSLASQLAAAGKVQVTLTGPGISPLSTTCTWALNLFQCNIKTPSVIRTGSANPYVLTASEEIGNVFVLALPVGSATNPETIFFS
jgi:hypothetical protein